MEFWTPYNDISEFGNLGIGKLPGVPRNIYSSTPPQDIFPEAEKMIKTPLAFAHFARRDYLSKAISEYQQMLESAGWKLISSTLNWHSQHQGDNELTLWMKKFPQNLPVEQLRACPLKERYGNDRHMYPCHKSFLFGCGGRLLEGFKDIRDEGIAWTKFLTLIRVPVEKKITPARERWLRAMNYRPLPAEFSTSVATYWVNGFEKWPGKDAENEFWQKWTEPKHPAIKRASIKPCPIYEP